MGKIVSGRRSKISIFVTLTSLLVAGADSSVAAGLADAITKPQTGKDAPKVADTPPEGKEAGDKLQAKPEKTGTGATAQAPVKVTVEWNGRKVTVEIPDDREQADKKANAAGTAQPHRQGGQGAGNPATAGKGGKSRKEQPPWKATLEKALNKVLEDSLEPYDAKTITENDFKTIMERARNGLERSIKAMKLVQDATGDSRIVMPEMNEAAPNLGSNDKLGAIE